MAVGSNQITVGITTPVRIDLTADGKELAYVLAKNMAAIGGQAIFVGPNTVTAGTGYQLDPQQAVGIDLGADDSLYGVTASGTAACHVLGRGAQ